ncbi:hypothetical protein DBR27_12220 [Flavobacterium sp. HMWF030]|nr:hypothetical protein DBR27_12220 [Flavobacterium sp. HMWF030]
MKSLANFKGAREKKMVLTSKKKIYEKLYNNLPLAIDKSLEELISSIKNKEFDYTNEESLITNLELLKIQIIVYQQNITK